MLYFAPLDQNIMGQIILSESVCEIIHNVQTEHCLMPKIENIRASYSTILLNYNKYAVEYDGGVRVTIAHELVHLMFHGRFLKLLQLLGEENIELNFSTGPFTLAENMTDTQKALCIAEWQADVLAMRLAIPSCTINDNLTIATLKVKNKYEITNRGDRNQACVKELAEIYGVSCIVAKERMRQLGFDFVDGTFNECDGKLMPPFIFPINTLKDNETFVIKSSNYERLLYENKEFADLIYSGRYIYLGYIVCLVDQKYINILINETGLHFQLTNYAREHADECCIKFVVKSGYNKDEKYINYGHTYLYKIDEEPLKQYEACIPDELKTNIDDFAKEDSRLNTMQTYFEVLSYYMFEDNRDPVQVKDESGDFTHEANNIIKEYEEKFGLSGTMIKRYLNNGSPPKLKTAMYICHKLGLNETQSREMLKRAGYYIDAPTPENMVCRLIFRLSYKQADTIFDNWEACVKYFKELTSKSTSLPKL